MLVHKNENQTWRLINHLSYDFDVFVHIDKKSKIKVESKNNVFVYKKYKTYWGSFNQIMATLYLLSEAHRKNYDRYILISGQDLPIKTNDEIKEFFKNNQSEYIQIDKIPKEDGWPDMRRLTRYHVQRQYCSKEMKYNIPYRIQRKIFYVFSNLKPRKLDYEFYGGFNWTNYTHNCVEKIFEYLKNNKKYIKRYKWTECADEIFYQTIIYQIEGINIINNCLRYVDWESGPERPRTLRINDYEKIMESSNLFARKFDETVDIEIIEKIYETIEK